jgi:hypothetical protein
VNFKTDLAELVHGTCLHLFYYFQYQPLVKGNWEPTSILIHIYDTLFSQIRRVTRIQGVSYWTPEHAWPDQHHLPAILSLWIGQHQKHQPRTRSIVSSSCSFHISLHTLPTAFRNATPSRPKIPQNIEKKKKKTPLILKNPGPLLHPPHRHRILIPVSTTHPDDIAISPHTSPGCGRIGCFRPEKSTWESLLSTRQPAHLPELSRGATVWGECIFSPRRKNPRYVVQERRPVWGWMMGAMAGLRKGIGHQKWAVGSDSWV